jgi:CRP-like cAMP-binding protein
LLRSFTVDSKGVEHAVMFGMEDWWISDFYSMLSNTPAKLHIDALEDSEVLQIDINDLQTLYEKVDKFNKFFRILLQNAFISHQRRIVTSLTDTAEERYKTFIKSYPKLEQRLPQHHVASYLGLTPETLSRIRKQWSKG